MYTYPINHVELEPLEQYSKEHKTPLIAVHSTGFYSYFTVRLPGTFPIVDTHPDETATTDLRLLSPWPELVEFAKNMTKDIDGLDNFEHGHLPYVVILLHYLDQWKATHNGAYPSNYKEKTEFRQLVRDAARTDNPEGGEENFDEAAAAVLKTVTSSSLPSGLKEVFEYEHKDTVRCDVPRRLSSVNTTSADTMLIRSKRGQCSGSSRTRSICSILSTAPCHFRAMFRT